MHTTTIDTIGQRGDWRKVNDLYRQFSRIATHRGDTHGPSPQIAGGLAEALARVFASYENNEEAFVEDLTTLFAEIDNAPEDPAERFQRLYKDVRLDGVDAYRADLNSRRRPRPFEAAVETVRRIQDLNRIRDVLENLPSSAVLGGSVSYGRFYNTCGAAGKPSDIDLLVVLPSYDELAQVPARLGELPFISAAHIEQMVERVALFPTIRKAYPLTVFQQKLRVWGGPLIHPHTMLYQNPSYYSLAIHIMSIDDFQFLALSDIPRLESLDRSLHEYRGDAPSGTANSLRCFAGFPRTFDQQTDTVDGGFVTHEVVAQVHDNRFYPGMHLNLLLPQFEVRWEASDLRLRLSLLNLRWKLLSRLSDERQLRSFEIQNLSLSHTRGAVFAPHVTRRVDRD